MSVISDYFKKTMPAVETGRPLHCIFYSHAWLVYELTTLGLVHPKQDMLLELATQSSLALVFNANNKNYDTLLDLLQPDVHLDDLGEQYKHVDTPLVLAPSFKVSVQNLLSALAVVSCDVSPVKKVVILVDYRDAQKFAEAYAWMDSFSIVWDVADYPTADLQTLAEILVQEGCLETGQRWQGFHVCSSPYRRLPDTQQRTAMLMELLNGFPLLKPAQS